jgi:CelD/BcsL family acetyltransferase involved in cellulose biosynthesis
MTLTSVVVSDEPGLDAYLEPWDRLAVRLSRPFCAPAWLMAWFRHVAAPGAHLRVVTVCDGEELIGVAPFFAEAGGGQVTRWRPLGAGTCQRVEPLAVPGREGEVAEMIGQAVLTADADVLTLEGVSSSSPWPSLLARSFPGRRGAWTHRRGVRTALTIPLDGTFDDWFAKRSSHFRQRLRKARKDFVKRGGTARLATGVTLEQDIESFIRLHRQRWETRGGSRALTSGVDDMLREGGRRLAAGERLRIWSLDVDDVTIASSVVLAAGGELGYWLNGFDERLASISPSRLSILRVVEDAFTVGATRLDLGEGDFPYKRRFADDEESLGWYWVVPRSRRYPLARASLAPSQARGAVARRLPPERRAMLAKRFLPGRSG